MGHPFSKDCRQFCTRTVQEEEQEHVGMQDTELHLCPRDSGASCEVVEDKEHASKRKVGGVHRDMQPSGSVHHGNDGSILEEEGASDKVE
jgi:hypothetical protein